MASKTTRFATTLIILLFLVPLIHSQEPLQMGNMYKYTYQTSADTSQVELDLEFASESFEIRPLIMIKGMASTTLIIKAKIPQNFNNSSVISELTSENKSVTVNESLRFVDIKVLFDTLQPYCLQYNLCTLTFQLSKRTSDVDYYILPVQELQALNTILSPINLDSILAFNTIKFLFPEPNFELKSNVLQSTDISNRSMIYRFYYSQTNKFSTTLGFKQPYYTQGYDIEYVQSIDEIWGFDFTENTDSGFNRNYYNFLHCDSCKVYIQLCIYENNDGIEFFIPEVKSMDSVIVLNKENYPDQTEFVFELQASSLQSFIQLEKQRDLENLKSTHKQFYYHVMVVKGAKSGYSDRAIEYTQNRMVNRYVYSNNEIDTDTVFVSVTKQSNLEEAILNSHTILSLPFQIKNEEFRIPQTETSFGFLYSAEKKSTKLNIREGFPNMKVFINKCGKSQANCKMPYQKVNDHQGKEDDTEGRDQYIDINNNSRTVYAVYVSININSYEHEEARFMSKNLLESQVFFITKAELVVFDKFVFKLGFPVIFLIFIFEIVFFLIIFVLILSYYYYNKHKIDSYLRNKWEQLWDRCQKQRQHQHIQQQQQNQQYPEQKEYDVQSKSSAGQRSQGNPTDINNEEIA